MSDHKCEHGNPIEHWCTWCETKEDSYQRIRDLEAQLAIAAEALEEIEAEGCARFGHSATLPSQHAAEALAKIRGTK